METWERGWRWRPGNEATRGGDLGMRLEVETWERGWRWRPGNEATRGGDLGMRLLEVEETWE